MFHSLWLHLLSHTANPSLPTSQTRRGEQARSCCNYRGTVSSPAAESLVSCETAIWPPTCCPRRCLPSLHSHRHMPPQLTQSYEHTGLEFSSGSNKECKCKTVQDKGLWKLSFAQLEWQHLLCINDHCWESS